MTCPSSGTEFVGIESIPEQRVTSFRRLWKLATPKSGECKEGKIGAKGRLLLGGRFVVEGEARCFPSSCVKSGSRRRWGGMSSRRRWFIPFRLGRSGRVSVPPVFPRARARVISPTGRAEER